MDYSFLYKIILCFLFSFFIGIERQFRKKIIGLRTSILVAIGAFLFVTFSLNVGASDISRIASQVVAGIGFLGAGVILKDGKKIRGLTTAATLWCDAAIGVLCAGGAIIEAFIGTIIILFSNIVLKNINTFINNITNDKDMLSLYSLDLSINKKQFDVIKKEIESFLKTNMIEITKKAYEEDFLEYKLNYKFSIKKEDIKIIDKIEEIVLSKKIKKYNLIKVMDLKIDEFED